MRKIRMDDKVIVIAGRDKGKIGVVKKVYPKLNKLVIDGVNVVKKCVKANQESPNGGITSKEAMIHVSNVALVDPKSGKATRVKIVINDGKSTRVAVKSGTVLS